MAWSPFRKKKTLAGLDVGSSAVKVAELRRRSGGLELVHAGVETLPPDVVVDSAVADSTTLANAVVRLLAEAEVEARALVTGVSGNSVIVRKLTLPALPEPQLGEAVLREAGQHLPFGLDEVDLDYHILFDPRGSHGAQTGHEAPGQTMDVLLCAARKERILSYGHVLALAGCVVEVVDLDVLALQNCYEYNYQPGEGTVVALLNVGNFTLNLSVVRGAQPLFTRDIAVGGHQYTDALQKEFDLSDEEAEQVKLGRAARPDGEVAAVMRQVNQIVAQEVRKTLDYARMTAGDAVERMYLAGGGARVPGLATALEQEFGVGVESLNPFRRIAVPARGPVAEMVVAHPEQMAVATGLALRSFDAA
jgi:type IV pilus assembly protein PilM